MASASASASKLFIDSVIDSNKPEIESLNVWAIFDQSCDRIHRIGTQQAVFIYNLIVKDSIDEKVWELVNTKKALGDYLIDDHLSNDQFDQLKKYIEDLKIS